MGIVIMVKICVGRRYRNCSLSIEFYTFISDMHVCGLVSLC